MTPTNENYDNTNPVEKFAREEFPENSFTAFAKAADVNYGTVHKTIQGLYSNIPTKLVAYMAQHSSYTVERWQNKYLLWVKTQMNILKDDIERGHIEATALFMEPDRLAVVYPTFVDWRQSLSYSQIDFCKTFFLHQGILSKYEAGGMSNLPKSLAERLFYLGKDFEYVKAVGKLKV